ncbi:hypothetical protein WJX77_011878 [Trebouxia sp. C0004]
MPGAKNQPATHKQRWQAVNLKELHPELSYRRIGSKIAKSQTFASKWIRLARLHNSVADQPSPENRHSVLARHHDHTQQHFQNAFHGKASWQLVYPSHKGNSRKAQAQPGSALLYGHDLLGCHHPQVCDRHTQTGTEVHQPQDKRAFAGVGSKEYNDVLQQHLIPEGKRLFQQAGRRADKWKLQQDNSPAHKTKENMQCIRDNVPGGLFLEWPPNSPGLSPIENLWAWMEQQLRDREGIDNTDDLQCRLMAIRDSITLTQLHDLFDGMSARMKLVVKLQGSHIGK